MALFALLLFYYVTTVISQTDFSYYNNTGSYSVANSTSDGYPIWYPLNTAKNQNLPIYIFCAGTGATPLLYSQTLQLVASHGFISIGSWMEGNHDAIHAIKYIESSKVKWPANIQGTPNTSAIVTGGHSGGGPVALWAGIGGDKFFPKKLPYVLGFVGQHAAAIPGINEPTKQMIQDIGGPIMTTCGKYDTVAYCTCKYAMKDYFDKATEKQGRIYVDAPDTHVTGTQGIDGRDYEGGFIVAFLYYTLLNDQQAKIALNQTIKGYTVENQL
eukprot:316574_1